MGSLNEILKQFEAAEANLAKLQGLWKKIKILIPEDLCFGDDTDGKYDNLCRDFRFIRNSLPRIDGWQLPDSLLDLDEIGSHRLDAMEDFDIRGKVAVENHIYAQERHLQEYKYRLDRKRRELVRDRLLEEFDLASAAMIQLESDFRPTNDSTGSVSGSEWDKFKTSVAKIEMLMGSSIKRPSRWPDLNRHLHYGMVGDLYDILTHDWPNVSAELPKSIYGDTDPIPVSVDDLGSLVDSRPSGEVVTQLKWEVLDDDQFERLIFNLISRTDGYENASWLTRSRASDRGRDLSCDRVIIDKLGGVKRHRVIIQCKHWLAKSIGPSEFSTLRDQMKLWEPPRVNVLVIATSGRFTTDAVQMIENHNHSDTALHVEPWAESHLESLLAERPDLIGEFGLR